MIYVDSDNMRRHKKYLMYHDDSITGLRTVTIFTIRRKFSPTANICMQYATHVRLEGTKKVVSSFNKGEVLITTSFPLSDIIFFEITDDEFNTNVLADII
jgi:hypothetical protein